MAVQFDFANKVHRDLRRCRTRAIAARLLAQYPVHYSNSDVWQAIAASWEQLAEIKVQSADTDARKAKLAAELKQGEEALTEGQITEWFPGPKPNFV